MLIVDLELFCPGLKCAFVELSPAEIGFPLLFQSVLLLPSLRRPEQEFHQAKRVESRQPAEALGSFGRVVEIPKKIGQHVPVIESRNVTAKAPYIALPRNAPFMLTRFPSCSPRCSSLASPAPSRLPPAPLVLPLKRAYSLSRSKTAIPNPMIGA